MIKNGNHYIVVVDAGFVYTGKCTLHFPEAPEVPYLTIEDCRNIREWKTTKGLGQLAVEGWQPGTQLDDCGTYIGALSRVIHFLPCGPAPRNK